MGAAADALSPAPSLLLISAGFDGALGDEGCTRDGIPGLDLTVGDYAWATAQLRGVVDEVNRLVRQQQRQSNRTPALPPVAGIVSALEGGYGCWEDTTHSYDRSMLAKCCLAHVRALHPQL